MRPFTYAQASAPEAAVAAASVMTAPVDAHVLAPVQYIAGGTTLLDLMKLDVMRPERVIDIARLAGPGLNTVEATADGLRIGALVKMSQAAEHEAIKRDYPALSQSLWLAASAQLRNMATIGGNVLQRTRCSYFRDVSWSQCNKRVPGSGCAALGGVNRLHAVLGASDNCIASYPGDFAQALIAFDARVEVLGSRGPYSLPFADLHRPPGDAPHIETKLSPGDLIVSVVVPSGPWTRRSLYLKVRDRESYAFALASAAVALAMDGENVGEARIGLGGVATTPWRAREAEDALRGRKIDAASVREAAEAAFRDAKARKHNAYKIELGKRTLERALLTAAAMEV